MEQQQLTTNVKEIVKYKGNSGQTIISAVNSGQEAAPTQPSQVYMDGWWWSGEKNAFW